MKKFFQLSLLNSKMKYLLVILIIYISCSEAKSQSRIWEVSDSLVILHKNLNFNTIQNVSISCIDKNNCIAFSTKGDSGAILRKTSDGGNNWEIIYVDTTILHYDDMGKLDSTTYWATEYSNFKYFENRAISFIIKKRYSTSNYFQIKSNDFGKNWDTVKVFENYYPWYYYFQDNSILLTKFYNDKLIYDLYLQEVNDTKWNKINLPYEYKLNAPHFFLKDNDNFIIVLRADDNSIKILRLFNEFQEWEVFPLEQIMFTDICFIDNTLFGLTSYIDNNIRRDIIYKSFDYGKKWQIVLDTNARNLKKIEFYSKDVGIAYGHTNYNVLRTTDGGVSWFNDFFGGRDSSKLTKTVEISDVAIIDKDNIFLLVQRDPIYKLTDKIVNSYSYNDHVGDFNIFNLRL